MKPKLVVKGRKVSKEVKRIQEDSDEDESEEKPRVQTRKASIEKIRKQSKQVEEVMEDENDEDGEFEVKVGGLSFNAYDEDVRSFFNENCGNVINVKLLTRPDGKPKGLGFVKFSKKSSFNKAIELNGCEHMGRSLNIEEAYGQQQGGNNFGNKQNDRRAPRQDNGPANIETPTLFIGGLSYNSTAESIKEFFAACGAVQSARVVTDKETGNVIVFLFSPEVLDTLNSLMSIQQKKLTKK